MATLGDSISEGTVSIFTGPFGSSLHSYDYVDDGIPVVPTEAIVSGRLDSSAFPKIKREKADELSRYELRQGDLVFARRGAQACGLSAIVDADCEGAIAGTGTIVARINDPKRIHSRYFSYLVGAPESVAWLKHHAVGATMPNLNSGIIATLPVSFPPLEEQKTIAAVLGALDDKIELNRRMNATLEAMARALFQSWFVDFGPVRANMAGRDRSTGEQGVNAALFPAQFQDSELGKIPQGWRVGTVGETFNVTMGQSPPGESYNEEGKGLPFFQGRRDFGFRFPTRRIFCTAPTRLAEAGDTLVSVRAPVGDINMADEACCVGRGVAAVRHKTGASSFTYYSMANHVEDFERFEAHGTVFGAINKNDFQNLACIVPPVEIVAAYEELAGPMDAEIRALEHQSNTLVILRDALLPNLLSGKLNSITLYL